MSDLQRYIQKRKVTDADFAKGYEVGYADFKIGGLLRQAREVAGLTQEQVADAMGTKKSAISRIENHAENVTIATLNANALGQTLNIQLVSPSG